MADDDAAYHPVVIAVCVVSQGVDRKDAVNVAEAAVRNAVGTELTVSIPWIGTDTGITRTVQVSYVREVNNAAQTRWLTIGTAPPRSFGAELMRRQGPPFGVGSVHTDASGADEKDERYRDQ